MVDLPILPEIKTVIEENPNHPLKEFAVIYRQQVEWGDMDTFGHVNNVIYYTYAQNARIHYNSQLKLFNENTFSVMASSSCQYFKPVTFPDVLWIGVKIRKIGNTSLVHEYTYYSVRLNEIVARGESVLVYLDKDTQQKKPIELNKKSAICKLEGLD